jgi:hypothetical protein
MRTDYARRPVGMIGAAQYGIKNGPREAGR